MHAPYIPISITLLFLLFQQDVESFTITNIGRMMSHHHHRTPHTFLQMSSNDNQQPSSPQQQQLLSPKALVNRGMNTFKQGNVAESIQYFDQAEGGGGMSSITPFLWQRGISYYYADKFQEGSKQFRIDVKVNPLDVEEIVWDIACLNRLSSDNTTPKDQMMSLPKGKTDRRKIMSTVYSLFRGDGATEHDLADAGHTGSQSDEFYSLFYLGLYCESKGERSKAEQYMKAAKNSSYATGYGAADYMTDCARVHCQLRGWM
uniref:Uncharacterized protein n=2 Tax=Ditylum brightwellii TaxID=49249 RepID=A0A7S4R933_9STRA